MTSNKSNLRIRSFSTLLIFMFIAGLAINENIVQGQEPTSTMRESVACNQFHVNRSLLSYHEYFGIDLASHLLNLGDDVHILDSGSGNCLALGGLYKHLSGEEYTLFHDNEDLPKLTGISYKVDHDRMPETLKSADAKERVRIIEGRYFEDLSNKEILGGRAPFDLVLDVYGVFNYTSAPDEVIKRYLQMLKDGGVIYLANETRYSRSDECKGDNWGKSVFTRDGRQVDLIEWLKENIEGATITEKYVRIGTHSRNLQRAIMIYKVKEGDKVGFKSKLSMKERILDSAPPAVDFEEKALDLKKYKKHRKEKSTEENAHY